MASKKVVKPAVKKNTVKVNKPDNSYIGAYWKVRIDVTERHPFKPTQVVFITNADGVTFSKLVVLVKEWLGKNFRVVPYDTREEGVRLVECGVRRLACTATKVVVKSPVARKYGLKKYLNWLTVNYNSLRYKNKRDRFQDSPVKFNLYVTKSADPLYFNNGVKYNIIEPLRERGYISEDKPEQWDNTKEYPRTRPMSYAIDGTVGPR